MSRDPASPAAPAPPATLPPPLDVDALLDDPAIRIIVCCGAGGVGKTTVAAALGVRAAGRGRNVVVLTIDPARRLAQSMGLTELDNTPRRVPGVEPPNGGDLHAMMLDMKRTFDEIVVAHADPQRAAQILENPFYQSLSSSFAGTQEYMAMEKLGQLRRQDAWDLIVVDTPPSRSALDFLDAPQRLGSFLDGRLIRLLAAPARAGSRVSLRLMSAGMGIVSKTMTRVLGAQLLRDVQSFVGGLDSMFGGFRERADETFRLLKDKETSFLVVATPERDALREATYFVRRLSDDAMPLGGLILNRVHRSSAESLSAERALTAAEDLEQRENGPASGDDGTAGDPDSGDSAGPADGTGTAGGAPADRVTAALLRLHAERMRIIARERQLTRRFTRACPTVAVAEIPAQPGDIHDVDGLRLVGETLTGKP